MKVLFMGTPDFAVPQLEALHQAGHMICAVVSRMDKPKGRGHKLTPPPVKVCAEQLGIPVYQPATLKEGALQSILDEYQPEIIVVVAYGKILPKYILDYPKYGCVNLHASLLPKYRGAAPIQWAVINGEKESGVTTMYMAEGLDTGDMLLKASVPISDTMTGGELHDRLMELGTTLLCDTLTGLEQGTITPVPQDDQESCYAPMLDKSVCRIDWKADAKQIVNRIRGLNPSPAAYTILDGAVLKIYSAKVCGQTGAPGELLEKRERLIVGAGNGSVELTEVMLAGKKRMNTSDFLRGYTPVTLEP